MQLLLIPPDKLQAAWAHIEPFAVRMEQDSEGKTTAADIAQYALSGEYVLWVVVDDSGNPAALVVVRIVPYAAGKAVRFIGCVGVGRKAWSHLKSEIEQWAVAQGCVRSIMQCRKGWAREFPDYKLTHVILEKPL